jgi:hypothetical protein
LNDCSIKSLLIIIDALLSDIVSRLPSKKYTLFYLTTPREFEENDSPVYQQQSDLYQDPVHIDLKRDYAVHSRREETINSSLFDEYQYFTPGPCFLSYSNMAAF